MAHVATHCAGACRCTLVVLTWASTCPAGVVLVNVTIMCETVVPVLVLFYRQGGEAAWGLMSSIAAAVTAAIATAVAATTTTTVTTAVCIATAAATTVAITANVVAAIAATIVATALLAAVASIPGASWLLLWGLAGANCLAEHLKLPLNCQDVGGIRS